MRLHDGERHSRRERRVDDAAKGHLLAGGNAAPPHVIDCLEGVPQPQRACEAAHLGFASPKQQFESRHMHFINFSVFFLLLHAQAVGWQL
jgi:NADPH-dependent ferric siderophore reductase